MPTIRALHALEILDSRGRPTLQATCVLESGHSAAASVPSGASTGRAEALELRDGDRARYRGLGCRRAAAHIGGEIHSILAGKELDQAQLDGAMIAADGTANKARLGANAILAVSLAFARAAAAQQSIPLYRYFAALTPGAGQTLSALPRPTINLFSGGKHAGGQIAIQDVLIVPISASRLDDALAMTYEVYQCAAELVLKKYGMRALTADEGGLAPNFASAGAMLDDALTAIERAGLRPGVDVALALDAAASQFFRAGRYFLGGTSLDGGGMIAQLEDWLAQYPIISLEDGLAEEDWPHWTQFTAAHGAKLRIMGDDLLCTHPARIQKAIELKAANALLLKVNQIGTLTEAAQALQLARAAGWHVTVSARSGETEDNWLADLAVGWRGEHIKIGSITQSERLAKYNRLLAIAAETGWPLRD